MQFHIELRDDGTYLAKSTGTVKFKRELGNLLNIRDVLYVPRLKKKLVSASAVEDKGFELIFSRGKAFIKPSNFGVAKQIGLRLKSTLR